MSKTLASAITQSAINDPVTLIGRNLFAVQAAALCSKVLHLLKPGAQQRAAAEAADTISIQGPAAHSPKTIGNLQAVLSRQEKAELHLAEEPQLSSSANRRQFLGELLRDCGFFAHLVFRQVRTAGNPSRRLADRDSPRKRLQVVKISPTPPRPSSDRLPRQRPVEAPGLEPEASSSLLQSLWVEVGCRHVQPLVAEKERHEYGEDSKPAL